MRTHSTERLQPMAMSIQRKGVGEEATRQSSVSWATSNSAKSVGVAPSASRRSRDHHRSRSAVIWVSEGRGADGSVMVLTVIMVADRAGRLAGLWLVSFFSR